MSDAMTQGNDTWQLFIGKDTSLSAMIGWDSHMGSKIGYTEKMLALDPSETLPLSAINRST